MLRQGRRGDRAGGVLHLILTVLSTTGASQEVEPPLAEQEETEHRAARISGEKEDFRQKSFY